MSITRGLPRPVFTHNPLRLPVVQIQNGTFYKQNPVQNQPALQLFPNLSFDVPPAGKEIWAVVGPGSSGKTTLLEILRGLHLCDPPQARQFPALASAEKNGEQKQLDPLRVTKYVGFGSAGQSLGPAETRGAYLSARFESRREATDFSLADYLAGSVSLNPDESEKAVANAVRKEYFFQFVAERMNLHNLLDMPVSNLSNGQTRRARVGKALMAKPHLLLLDEPFIGLDPITKKSFNAVLHRLIRENDLPIVFALQAQEEVPSFVSHVLYLNEEMKEEARGRKDSITTQGQLMFAVKSPWKHFEQIPGEDSQEPSKEQSALREYVQQFITCDLAPRYLPVWWDMSDVRTAPSTDTDPAVESIVDMEGVKVSYGDRTVIGDWDQDHDGQRKSGLWWQIKPGERWGVFGPNGSGKTTLLSLICSDHPQAYSLPMKMFGRSRLPTLSQPGISIFDLQARIGQSSPEILNFFPKHLTVRQTLESAWADTFLSKPRLSHQGDDAIDACLRWFAPELAPSGSQSLRASFFDLRRIDQMAAKSIAQRCADYKAQDLEWADSVRFCDLSLEAQKVALFLRALVKKPELVILDEAFSGMDETTRAKCMLFLAYGEGCMFSPKKSSAGSKFKGVQDNARAPSLLALNGDVTVTGLEPRQALLCVSHRRQEVPPILQQWLCLPESRDEAGAASGAPVRLGGFGFAAGPPHSDGDWLRGPWWQRIWGGEGWSPDGSYMMVEKLPFYKWQNQRRRKGYDIRKPESRWGAKTWLKRFTGAEARRQRTEWMEGQRARAEWERGRKDRLGRKGRRGGKKGESGE